MAAGGVERRACVADAYGEGSPPVRIRRPHIPLSRTAAAIAVACLCALAAASPAAARDRTPPRIASATTKDTDHDGQIDAVRVRYSEKVGLLSGKGSMRLRVAGYTVGSRRLGSPVTKLKTAKRCYPKRSIRSVSRIV